MAIGLGMVNVADERCAVVSPASPIGEALQGKGVGDQVTLNGKLLTIREIY